jgi:tripartite-type tricarboxylate transporter receptor subunit TctC
LQKERELMKTLATALLLVLAPLVAFGQAAGFPIQLTRILVPSNMGSGASFFVRAETPDDVTNKRYEGFRKVMASPEAKAYQATLPAVLTDLSPQDVRALVSAEYERFKRIAHSAGIKAG